MWRKKMSPLYLCKESFSLMDALDMICSLQTTHRYSWAKRINKGAAVRNSWVKQNEILKMFDETSAWETIIMLAWILT